jgi:hypothetical protein
MKPRHAREDLAESAAELGHALASTSGLTPRTVYPPARGPVATPDAGGAHLSAVMRQAIAGLRGSITYHLAVEAYQRHVDAGHGSCAWCGRETPCTARLHAAAVIEAAGGSPREYDRHAADGPAEGLSGDGLLGDGPGRTAQLPRREWWEF